MNQNKSSKIIKLIVLGIFVIGIGYVVANSALNLSGQQGAVGRFFSAGTIQKAPDISPSVDNTGATLYTPPMSGNVTIVRNTAYGDQTIPAYTHHFKIASYVVTNSTNETVQLSLIKPFAGVVTVTTADFTNVSVNLGNTQISQNYSTGFSPNPLLINPTTVMLSQNQSIILDIYSDFGGAQAGTIQTVLFVNAVGQLSHGTYTQTLGATGQTITIFRPVTQTPQPYIWLYGFRSNASCDNSHCAAETLVLKSDTAGGNWHELTHWYPFADVTAPYAGGNYFNGLFRDYGSSFFYSPTYINPTEFSSKSSPDGITWTDTTTNVPAYFPENNYMVVQSDPTSTTPKYDYLFGGKDDSQQVLNVFNSLWRSPDGNNWTHISTPQISPTRISGAVAAMGNKLFMMGGANYPNIYNDVWSSSDSGVTWTQITQHAPWTARYNFSALTYSGKIWIFGGADLSGQNQSDVWNSSDGISWTQVTASAPWGGLQTPCVLVFNHKIFLIGGQMSTGNSSLVWSSSDGANWTQVSDIGNLAFGGFSSGMCATIPYAVN